MVPLSQSTANGTSPGIDLTDCDREPIHALGAIQSFGFLVAFSTDWLIVRVSANVADHLGIAAPVLLGRPVHNLFSREAVHALRNRLVFLYDDDAVERIFGLALMTTAPDRLFDCAIHRLGALVVVEAEPSSAVDPHGAGTLIRAMMSRLEAARDLPDLLRLGARQMHGLIGFDRVMVYRFDHDGAGEVVAEVARGDADSLLGLHYPASDIPQQARALYVRTPFRIIADVDAEPVPIVPAHDENGAPIDLSLSILRSVSRVHIEYLRNMGVAASLSVSIVVEGKLWGLFACHHHAPRCPSFAERTAAELFGQVFALKLETRERQVADAFDSTARAAGERLLAAVAGDAGLLENPAWIAETIGGILPCDGVAIWLDGRIARSGHAPSIEVLPAIVQRLGAMAGGVFATDHLAALVPQAADRVSTAAGMLAIPISRRPRDYVLLFRQEKVRTVMWAGDPAKALSAAGNDRRLGPRTSFAAWREEVRGRSKRFTDAELRVAETLRVSLIEIVLRLAESADDERRRATQRQEVLIAELNHRVRNILALIRGLVRQSRAPDMPLAAYVTTLDGRIEALARAHDQITEDKWGAARLRPLFEIEATIFASDGHGVVITGDEVMLEPTAFSTMALVVHELLTNSSKYGALSTSGKVFVDWTIAADRSLTIEWRERGGPATSPPTRQGFGTTIIERSIPYDLGGSVEVDYPPRGVEARMTIPGSYVRQVDGPAPATQPIAPRSDEPADAPDVPPLAERTVLLVEDSLIIAMDAQDLLTSLGAGRVATAATVAAALEELARSRPDVAVLDINLGGEASFPVADRLKELDVPFIFATGYGNQLQMPAAHVDVTILQKPYTLASLTAALTERVARLPEGTAIIEGDGR